jgi:hypothetical protein
MTNDKHISIDRDQYEQQVAELCELRAKMARLYDEAPIDAAWLEACGGKPMPSTCSLYKFDDLIVGQVKTGLWKIEGIWRYFSTRGEFLRAAELLGIEINEAANAAKGGA